MEPRSVAYHLIANPTAGGGRARRAALHWMGALRSQGHRADLVWSHDLWSLGPTVDAAVASGAVPVAVGGDGLVGAVAGLAAERGVTMGVLPCGRGNDFARSLGIRRRNALDALVRGVEIQVDLGRAGGRWFTGSASVGFDAVVVDRASRMAWCRSAAVYALATLASLPAWEPQQIEVWIDGIDHSFVGHLAAACNSGTYGGGMRIAPDARMDDGALDVVMIGPTSRSSFLAYAWRLWRGTHVRHPAVRVVRGERVRLRADPPLLVLDGEVTAPVDEIGVVRGALHVLAPRTAAEHHGGTVRAARRR